MASKRKDQTLKRQFYVGIDPGTRWVGVAVLRHDKGSFRAEMAVIDRTMKSFVQLVHFITPTNAMVKTDEVHVITEGFRHRPQGHQAWDAGETLRLIGAIRFATEEREAHWTEVEPGDPDKELDHLGLGRYIQAWKEHCPRPNDMKWHHGRAAWRAIGRYLLINNQLLLQQIRGSKMPALTFDGKGVTDGFDLVASVMTWRLGR